MINGHEDATRMPVPRDEGIPAPPRFLLWLVIGVFVLGVIAAVGGVVVFRSVLRPGQQERVIGILPFMQAFLPPRPAVNDTLPTPIPNENNTGISTLDLLGAPLDVNGATEATEEVTESASAESVSEATEALEASFAPTATSAAAIVLAPSATPIATQTATLAPTIPPTATSLPPTAVVQDVNVSIAGVAVDPSQQTIPPTARLGGFTHVKQTWNNCGPANITMALSFYGWRDGQEVAAALLKPDREDKNVNPSEMVAFVNENTGVRAISRIGGDMNLLKTFLANDFPVIVETGYMPEGYDWMGHYQTIVGYSDFDQLVYLYDSYLGSGENGAGIAERYDLFDENWQHFNRTFIVIYEQGREDRVREILGDRADLAGAAEIAFDIAQAEARETPQDWATWFNMGTALVRLQRYEEAAVAFDQARQLDTPWRILWYQHGPYEAYFNVGRYDDIMSLVESNLRNGGEYVEETHYWHGRVLEEMGRETEAVSAYNTALAHNPLFDAAQQALNEVNV